MSETEIKIILNELCVKLGICLHESEYAHLLNFDLSDEDELFLAKVFQAEGLDKDLHNDLFKKSKAIIEKIRDKDMVSIKDRLL